MTHRLAILGFPIGHSLSPVFHAAALRECGLQGSYEALDVHPADLSNEWTGTLSTEFNGFNVTTPHKVAIMPLLDRVSDAASAIGSVNTLVRENSTWTGYNTDVVGIEQSLLPYQSGLQHATVTLIGAGGAARAALWSLVTTIEVAEVYIINRNAESARALASAWSSDRCMMHTLEPGNAQIPGAIRRSALVVQATSLGMHPHPDDRPLPGMHEFVRDQIVFDLIYRPRETRFLRDAKAAGAIPVDGLDMFLHQAAASFAHWTGVRPPLDVIRPIIEKELHA